MAKQTITKILDDLTGEEADETVSYALDGNLYEIDLTAANAAKLREFLATYMDASTRVGRVGQQAQIRSFRGASSYQKPVSVRGTREVNQAIREWATGNGYELADRGRIPQHIQDAYSQRHATAAALAAEVTKAEPEVEQAAAPAAKPRKRTAPAATFSGSKQKIPA